MIVGVLAYREAQKFNNRITELSLDELPAGFNSYGIDVSRYQGTIDWDAFFNHSDSLMTFVYCKATEGCDHVDSQWKRNRTELVRRGKAHGAYHFFIPSKDPIIQAEHFLANYATDDNDLPPVLDAEIEGNSITALIKNMTLWLKHVEIKTGRRPIIYTSYHIYTTIFKSRFDGYKFWIANYNKNPKGFDDEDILHWQYSDKGKVPGISGDVDLNYSKVKF